MPGQQWSRSAGPEFDETHESRHIRLKLSRQPKIRRVDNFLSQHYRVFSRTFFQRLIKLDRLTVNGKTVTPSYRLQVGDVIEVDLPVEPERVIEPQDDIPLDIIHEDDELFVINKQPGIICHPGKNIRRDTLANAFVYHMHGMTTEAHNPGIVHRLDVDTTGVMVVAKNPFSHVFLARQFETRKTHKEYIALVRGRVKQRVGQIDTSIGFHPKRWGLMSTAPDANKPKPALSVYEVLERLRGYSLVGVVLKTGRTHQIRVHFESIGCPLVAEKYYRGDLGPDPLEKIIQRQALHAWKLRVLHPATREPVEFVAPLPEDFNAALAHLRSLQKPNEEL